MAKVEEPAPAPGDAAPVEELTEAAAREAELAVSPELVAGSVREYVRASLARMRAGESGVLPVVAGLLLVSILFQSLNSHFLTAGNLVNLLVQAAVFSLLAMGEVYALVLGEIDLSICFVAGIGGVVMAELAKPSIGLPSFVVTLAGLLFWQGVMLRILGAGGSVPINNTVINDIASGNLTPLAGWLVMLVVVGLFALATWRRDSKRRRAGLVAPPPTLTLMKIGAVLAGGVAIVALCNTDRGVIVPISGVPWVVLLVFGVLAVWTFVLGRSRLGRYMYAIGCNAEAARRAGINLAWIRTVALTLTSFTAGIAGVVYASRLRSISTALDGGTLVLYAVAAAVIGGTSLFGGRGKALHGVLGGIVIASIDNGMGLLGFSAASKFMVTAIVLLAAVTIDALARRGRTPGT